MYNNLFIIYIKCLTISIKLLINQFLLLLNKLKLFMKFSINNQSYNYLMKLLIRGIYYRILYYRWIQKRRRIKRRNKQTNKRKIINIKQNDIKRLKTHSQTLSKITQISEEQFIIKKYNKTTNPIIQPIKISLSNIPEFSYPEKIIVYVVKTSCQSSKTQKNFPQKSQPLPIHVSYKQNPNFMYVQMSSKQFLQTIKNRNTNLKNKNHYKNKLNHEQTQFNFMLPQMSLSPEHYELPFIIKQYFEIKQKQNENLHGQQNNQDNNNQDKNNKLYSVNLWHYTVQQTISSWHYDCHDNFLCQIQGYKEVCLKQPNSIQHIVKELKKINNNKNEQNNYNSYVKCETAFNNDSNHVKTLQSQENSFQSQQKFISCHKVLLYPSECLFIPRGWFHKVTSYSSSPLSQPSLLSPSNIAINFWSNTIPTVSLPINQLQINLKHLIFEISQKISQQTIPNYSQLSSQIQQQYKKIFFEKYLYYLLG